MMTICTVSFEGFMGFLVSVLSVLVTALLGWQICSIIDIKKWKIEIERKFYHALNNIDYSTALMYGRTSQMLSFSLIHIEKEEILYQTGASAMISIKMFCTLGCFTEANAIASSFYITLLNSDDCKLSKKQISSLIAELNKIPHHDKLQDYINIQNALIQRYKDL